MKAPSYLDSEAVLKRIEVQQGILVERAEGIYSFSHITLQEYLTAQYLIDNGEWEALIKENVTSDRWQDIFLLLPGLMPGRTQGDTLLQILERCAQQYCHNSEVQRLLQWIEKTTEGESQYLTPTARRISAILLILALSLDFRLLENGAVESAMSDVVRLAYALAESLEIWIDISISRDSRALDQTLSLIETYENSSIFSNVDFDRLKHELKELYEGRPQTLNQNEEAMFWGEWYELWFSTLGLDIKHMDLSDTDLMQLSKYLYVCKLMVSCKENAVRLSPAVWSNIESRILTIPEDISSE